MNLQVVKKKRLMRDRKRLERIRFNMIGITREEYEAPWEGHPGQGVLFQLHNFCGIKDLSYKQFGGLIYYRDMAVKNIFEHYLRKSSLRDIIIRNGYGKNDVRAKWMLDENYKNMPYDALLTLFLKTHYRTLYGPNGLESLALRAFDKIFPDEWEFTGVRHLGNRVMMLNGKNYRYPDISNKKQRMICEVFGNWKHDEKWTRVNNIYHEKEVMKQYLQVGLKPLILWEDTIKYEDLLEEKIQNFVKLTKDISIEGPDAIQNFLQLVF